MPITFIAKKLISACLQPIPFIFIINLIGILIIICTIYRKTGISFILISTISLFVFSTGWVPNLMVAHLESRYPPLEPLPETIKTIVVLGGGNSGPSKYPANIRVNGAGLSRLVEGIRIAKKLNHYHLIFSGGRVFGTSDDASLMRHVAVTLGVDQNSITLEPKALDTYQAAVNLKQQLGTQPFILVTSAIHMPRAMAVFQKQGLHPIAAPSQFLVKSNYFNFRYFLPNSANIDRSSAAIHEYLGLLWAYLNHHI